MGRICKMTPPANFLSSIYPPQALKIVVQLKPWQTASTSWRTKPFPVFFANLWTAPVAVPRWGMWHWVQAQDFQWQPLLWLKLNLLLKPGGGQPVAAALDRCDLLIFYLFIFFNSLNKKADDLFLEVWIVAGYSIQKQLGCSCVICMR